MDEIGRRYLQLALHLDRHFEGFVDAYFGPPELKADIQVGDPRPLEALAEDAQQLLDAIETGVTDAQRRGFLEKQVQAMAAVVRNLSGDELDFLTEVQLYFDITPIMADESAFEEAHAAMDELLPGTGSLVERLSAWKDKLCLESDRILPVFDLALRETRRRTQQLFDLPPGEDLTLHLVENEPWGAYNWYLGGFASRIEINTDLPVRVDFAVPLIAHEAYPGHHTEHALKEQRLYQRLGRAEHAIQLLLAPECVLSEGIADSAQQMIFDDAELAAFLGERLYPLAGLSDLDAERQIRLHHATESLKGVSGNAALLLHMEGRPPEEVQAYIERYGLRTPEEASHSMRFLSNPLFRSYVFNYAMGKDLIAPLLEGPDALPNYRRLLTDPLTPSQVRDWLAQAGPAQHPEHG
ncbi:MAG: hypothetical protein ACK2UU_11255 [Anaerolineae bacterium]